MDEKTIARFWSKVERGGPDDCWPWRGGRDKDGYGHFTVNRPLPGKGYRAHRLAFSLSVRAVPAELQVLHKCDNPPCCNPKHLFVGTQGDNIRDCVAKGRYVNCAMRSPQLLPRGERQWNSKLTTDNILQMRDMVASGQRLHAVGRIFGVTKNTVQRIVSGRQWSHVGGARSGSLKSRNIGGAHGRAKLNEAQVIEIRAAVAKGESMTDVAGRFGVSRTTVSGIISRKEWRHI
jgi:HNH endonuclease